MGRDFEKALPVEFDTHQCDLPAVAIGKMQDGLDALSKAVESFPTAELRVLVKHHSRHNEFSVKTTLLLPNQTLVASDHKRVAHAAYEQCLSNLMRELKELKDKLSHVPERQKVEKGTRQDLRPTADPDWTTVLAAVADGDYSAFHSALQGYDEPLRDRIGRWVQRQPNAGGQVGHSFTIADAVEEVFLDAFEKWDERPAEVPVGDWLSTLIDPAVKELLRHPEKELENVRMVRTLQGVPAPRGEL